MAADLTKLNKEQRAAILESMDCNVALLAGAGSGKTATLVKRTEYLIDDMKVNPENIMLITFTNKAAKEIVERVAMVSPDAYEMMIGTFHGICVRLMRKHGHHLGINNFSIADDKDSKKMIKAICEGQNKDYSKQIIADIKKKISFYKSSLIKPSAVLSDYCSENKESYSFASIYQDYQNQCWKEKTFDFDDLIIYTVLLISSFPEVKQWMDENIKYIMVDETQDTSTDQFQLIKLIAGKNNLMLFGDINQSIYGFRNAKPEYLDSFCKMYPNSKLLKLSINYRSTKTIISAANAVINFNSFGEKVIMTTDNGIGEKIGVKHFNGFNANTDMAEAKWIASEMTLLVNMKKNNFEDFAIIYRTNMQSNELEKVFVQSGIPYTIIGSSSYWASKEMKDILSFCKMVLNPYDVASFKRALSTVRGVGKATQGKIIDYMNTNNLTTHDVLSSISFNNPEVYKGVSAHAQKELAKIEMMFGKDFVQCSEIAEYIINNTAYAEDLRLSNSDEAKQKLEIVEDSVNSFQQFELNGDSPESVIDQVSLMSDAKGDKKKELNAVKLLSGHACKGLEFNTVFVAGAEEGLFPHWNAINSIDKVKSIEEERRLFYVAITRAKKKLYLTSCARRKETTTTPSRFIKEIPSILIEECF